MIRNAITAVLLISLLIPQRAFPAQSSKSISDSGFGVPSSVPDSTTQGNKDFEEAFVENTVGGLNPDSRSHLWGLLHNSSGMLDEWDGTRWIAHPLPPGLISDNIESITSDNADRIWCMQRPNSEVGIYNQITKKWEMYTDWEHAKEIYTREPGFSLRSPQVSSFHKDDSDPDGVMRTRIRLGLRRLGFTYNQSRYVGSPVESQFGDWFFIDKQLYVLRDRAVEAQFNSNETNPYINSQVIGLVQEDATDHILLRTYLNDGYFRYVRLSMSMPHPVKLSVVSQTKDGITVKLDGGNTSDMYEWQVDNDPPAISHQQSMRIINALPGMHTISVVPVTKQLLPTTAMVKKTWRSAIKQNDQISRLIGQLETGPDPARMEAVDALKHYGDVAIPALTAARSAASESGKWWIDAFLEDRKGNASGGPVPMSKVVK